jgi:hypothetical protein
MKDFKKTKEKVLEAVAAARDETLVKVGKAAELRQGLRVSTVRRNKLGKIAMTAVVAGGAIAAGTMAVKAIRQRSLASK